jgi:hypothetical protein
MGHGGAFTQSHESFFRSWSGLFASHDNYIGEVGQIVPVAVLS